VIDRLQLYIFFAVTTAGTLKILFSAPDFLKVIDQHALLKSWDPAYSTTN
jgi:nicotinic acetylcholine receptor